jgi:hypothetical protein
MRNLLIALALGSAAMPASAATVLFDTGYKIEKAAINRPVNTTTTLLAQFNLAHMSTLDTVQNYGRVVTAGTALYSVYSDAGNQPGALLYSATKAFTSPTRLDWFGISGLSWTLDGANNYWVGFGQGTSDFTAFVRGTAPMPLGLEGSFKPTGYIATNNADLSWRISGATIAAAVPEPATWGMMILGFGLVGGMIRSARRRQGAVLAAA